MYFEIEEGHPDITPVGSAMSWREGALLSFVVHLAFLGLLMFAPNLLAIMPRSAEPENQLIEMKRPEERTTFVFVQPRVEMPALRESPRPEISDRDRSARSPLKAPSLDTPLPMARIALVLQFCSWSACRMNSTSSARSSTGRTW